MTKLRGSVELLGGNRNPCDATSVEPCVYVHRVTPLSSFPAMARDIFSIAFSDDKLPSGWKSGENSSGPWPRIVSLEQAKSRRALSLQSWKKPFSMKIIESCAVSKSSRYFYI